MKMWMEQQYREPAVRSVMEANSPFHIFHPPEGVQMLYSLRDREEKQTEENKDQREW